MNQKCMIRISLLLFFLTSSDEVFCQKIDLKVEKKLKKLEGVWISNPLNTQLRQKEIGINKLQMVLRDTLINQYSKLLTKYKNDYGFDDKITLRFLSYGSIEYQSYKFNKVIIRQAYCGIFSMADKDYLLMFSDLEDENKFIGFLFEFTIFHDSFTIDEEELGKISFKRE